MQLSLLTILHLLHHLQISGEAVPIPTSAIPTVPIPTCVIPTTRSIKRTVHCEKLYRKSVTTLPCEILISEKYSVPCMPCIVAEI